MRISRSIWRKALLTFAAAAAFVWFYEATIPDSRFLMLPLGFEWSQDSSAPPQPGVRVAFSATAYCKGQVTASGVAVQAGAVAADPTVLPGGSVINIDVDDRAYDGVYTVLDTGPEIKGHEIDVYMWSCYEALDFGRRPAFITVIRLGWDPHATTPTSFVDRIFRRPAPARAPAKPRVPEPSPAAAPEPTPDPELTPSPEPLQARPLPSISESPVAP